MRLSPRATTSALLGLLLTLGALGLASVGSADRAAPRPERAEVARRETPRDMRGVVAPPTADYEAHEWGVWRLESGRVAHLDELRRESPPFVVRLPTSSLPPSALQPTPVQPTPVQPGPGWGPGGGAVARKPVIFFYADHPMRVHVEVDFPGGEPWLAWPRPIAHLGRQQGQNSGRIVFDGALRPSLDVRNLPGIRPRHFWADLRGVGATPFVANGDPRQSERFLFYDGPIRFTRPVEAHPQDRFRVAHPAVTPGYPIWVVRGGQVQEQRMGSGGWAAPQGASFGVDALPDRLLPHLTANGLTGAEARSLLSVWRDDLRGPRPHAIYLVPRALYDRLLPIRLSPQPRTLVRVGLVIEIL